MDAGTLTVESCIFSNNEGWDGTTTGAGSSAGQGGAIASLNSISATTLIVRG